MSENIVINRSPSTEEAQDAVGAALQAPLVYDDASNMISINDGGVDSQFIAPTFTEHAEMGFTAITTAINVEQLLVTRTLPTVTYPTLVLLTFEAETYFPGSYPDGGDAGTYVWAGTTPATNYWGGTLALRSSKSVPSGTDQFKDAHYIGWQKFAANATRQISFGGLRTSATSQPQKRFHSIKTMEFHQ